MVMMIMMRTKDPLRHVTIVPQLIVMMTGLLLNIDHHPQEMNVPLPERNVPHQLEMTGHHLEMNVPHQREMNAPLREKNVPFQ